ncbi:hypothetical protein HDU91_003696, partial [Kappamyces sp. JEL0680]
MELTPVSKFMEVQPHSARVDHSLLKSQAENASSSLGKSWEFALPTSPPSRSTLESLKRSPLDPKQSWEKIENASFSLLAARARNARQRMKATWNNIVVWNASSFKVFDVASGSQTGLVEFTDDALSSLEVCVLYMPTQISMQQQNVTCVLCGLESGQFRVYDAAGSLIESRAFTAEPKPIVSISLRTLLPQDPASDRETDELALLYHDGTLVSIDALGLWMNVKMGQSCEDGFFELEPIPLVCTTTHLSLPAHMAQGEKDFSGSMIIALGPRPPHPLDPIRFSSITHEPILASPAVHQYLVLGSPFLLLYQLDPSS